jgi:hypothetical protein
MTVIQGLQRPRAPLDEAGRSRMEELLRAKRLVGYDRGALRALGRQATAHDRERIAGKLGTARASGPPVSQAQANSMILAEVRAEIERRRAEADDL